MNKIAVILIVLLLPMLLSADTGRNSAVSKSSSGKASIAAQSKASPDSDKNARVSDSVCIAVKGPNSVSESFRLQMNSGLVSFANGSASESYSMNMAFSAPKMLVPHLSSAQKTDKIEAAPKTPEEEIITEYALHQNYPNPFNPETNISFDLVDAGYVSLMVYNSLGQIVAAMVNGEMPAGRHSVNFSAESLPSGVYFYQMDAGEFHEVKKMILMK